MLHRLFALISKSINALVDYAYDGNFNIFKWDPVVGNILAVGFMAAVDKHVWGIVHFIGTTFALCITLALGTFLPSIYRYYAHKIADKYQKKYPVLKEILKHDKKNKDDDENR